MVERLEFVPVNDSAAAWKALYRKMAKGQTADINDIQLLDYSKISAVEGLPAKVRDMDGNYLAPKVAGNVIPPREPTPETPEIYDDTVPLGQGRSILQREDPPAMAKKKKRAQTKRKSSTTKKRASGGVRKKKSGGTKKKSAAGRKRSSITRKRK